MPHHRHVSPVFPVHTLLQNLLWQYPGAISIECEADSQASRSVRRLGICCMEGPAMMPGNIANSHAPCKRTRTEVAVRLNAALSDQTLQLTLLRLP